MKYWPILIVCLLLAVSCATVGTVTPLHEAVRDGDWNSVNDEIASGAKINSGDEEGRSPLHYACANGETEIVLLLLKNEADPNVVDVHGNSPLHYAASNCYDAIVKALLLAGADQALINTEGLDAKDAADRAGCFDIAKQLGDL